jgi:hypothetical protein
MVGIKYMTSKISPFLQQWAIDRWISGGAPHSKLVMGLTGTATTFTLANVTDAGVGAPVAGPGKVGPYLGIAGHASYYRVCFFSTAVDIVF